MIRIALTLYGLAIGAFTVRLAYLVGQDLWDRRRA